MLKNMVFRLLVKVGLFSCPFLLKTSVSCNGKCGLCDDFLKFVHSFDDEYGEEEGLVVCPVSDFTYVRCDGNCDICDRFLEFLESLGVT